MYINTYIVFCCCCCCETSRVSSSSLSVLATLPPHLHPLSPVCSLSCCQPSSPTAYGEEKLLPGIFYVFRLLIFAILTCWVFLFPFLCSALLCLALRRAHIFSLCLLPELWKRRQRKLFGLSFLLRLLFGCSAVRLFGQNERHFSVIFCNALFLCVFAFRRVFLFECVCVCVYVCVRVFAVAFCSGLIKFRGFGLREREQFNFNL